MSYIDDICNPLIKTLERSATLPIHPFAGHAANLDFWMDEVRHCLNVIDGYPQRFEKMKQAQQIQVEAEGGREMPLQRGIKDSERKDLRRKIVAIAHKFLDRCYNEKLIDEATWLVGHEKIECPHE